MHKTRRRGCGTQDGHRLWLNTDPCGLVCASFVYGIIAFSDYAVTRHVMFPLYGFSALFWVHVLCFHFLELLAVASHLRAMLSNPGAVPFNSKPTDPHYYEKECYRCTNFKPPRAHHCSTCNRCIIKMDHHCPWVNNCVGLANHKFFLLFLVYILAICVYALGLVGVRFFSCAAHAVPAAPGPAAASPGLATAGRLAACEWTAMDGLFVLGLAIVATMFALFTSCLLADQVSNVLSNTTAIDRFKERGPGEGEGQLRSESEEKRAVWDHLGEVFGGDPWKEGISLAWLLPTPIAYRNPESLTGYCFRDVQRPRTLEQLETV